MSGDWVNDIFVMHDHYGHHEAFDELDTDKLKRLLKFRIDFLEEELTEMKDAYARADENTAEDVVDAIIDLCVVAIGTLDAFEVDGHYAWNQVLEANMAKESGVNPTRPNELGLPDLIKPVGWTAPSHSDNHGKLDKMYGSASNVVTLPCAV
jgi:predicted HAD superfamily Cof-like phosphohydrolase